MALKGFRLASDNNGAAVQTQIIRYMKDNLGSKGIELIKKRLAQNKAVMEEQEKIQEGGLKEVPIDQEAPMEEISETNNPLEIIENIRSHGFSWTGTAGWRRFIRENSGSSVSSFEKRVKHGNGRTGSFIRKGFRNR